MTIEILYADGRTFEVSIPDEAVRNTAACLLDDDSVSLKEVHDV